MDKDNPRNEMERVVDKLKNDKKTQVFEVNFILFLVSII
jgi:hypothetical protein